MRISLRALAPAVALGTLALGGLASPVATAGPATPTKSHGHHHAVRLCTTVKGNKAACNAQKLVDDAGTAVNPMAAGGVRGLGPDDIRSAYNLTNASGSGRTVAIVDAYGYPNAERDLATYRNQFGLSACTTSNGCLSVVDQFGGQNLPAFNQGWAGEQALDLDAVSATCPDCKIVLVQARSASMADLGAAVNTAARIPGVVAISNSYGGADASDSSLGRYYNHPGIAVTASTGDNGYQGGSYPASSRYVTAVGGTSLYRDSYSQRGWSESAWAGAGSGCSSYNQAPTGQDSSMTGCDGRAMADVSAVADPNTGLAVYGPTGSYSSGWGIYGGTSLSSPIIASVFAMSGRTPGYSNDILYRASGGFNDVTDGSNGDCDNYCYAGQGWDGPTGLGTPDGVGAF